MSDKNWGGYTYKGEKPLKVSRPKAKKNTRRWCKGKVGREHTTTVEIVTTYGVARECSPAPHWWRSSWWCHHWIVCTTCGKHLEKVKDLDCPALRERVNTTLATAIETP